MASSARYTIHIPQTGTNLAGAALHHLYYGGGPRVENAFVHRGVEGHDGLHDHVVAIAPDGPEMDSHVKQLAHHIADAGRLTHINVLKENGKAINTWDVRNLNAERAT